MSACVLITDTALHLAIGGDCGNPQIASAYRGHKAFAPDVLRIGAGRNPPLMAGALQIDQLP